MNEQMSGTIVRGILAVAFPLVLAGCYSPHVVNSQDTLYCESQGFRPGTDANFQCAADRDAERDKGAIPPLEPTPPPRPFIAAAPPPDHAGFVSQTTPRSIPPDATRLINFTIAVNSDCVAVDIPKVRIGIQPLHGTLRLIRLTDFARLSQIGAPASCADKKVAGAALLYTPYKYYEGDDLVEIQVNTPVGQTYFKIPIAVEFPDTE